MRSNGLQSIHRSNYFLAHNFYTFFSTYLSGCFPARRCSASRSFRARCLFCASHFFFRILLMLNSRFVRIAGSVLCLLHCCSVSADIRVHFSETSFEGINCNCRRNCRQVPVVSRRNVYLFDHRMEYTKQTTSQHKLGFVSV